MKQVCLYLFSRKEEKNKILPIINDVNGFVLTEKRNSLMNQKRKKVAEKLCFCFGLAATHRTGQEIFVFLRLCVSNDFTEEWLDRCLLCARENIQIAGNPLCCVTEREKKRTRYM